MSDRRGMSPAHDLTQRDAPHRFVLGGLAAGALVLAAGFPAAAQQASGGPRDLLGSSGLRTGTDLDLSSSVRDGGQRTVAEPFATTPKRAAGQSAPRAPSDDAASDDADPLGAEDDDAPPRRRPKIDLFADPPPSARAERQNGASGASEPAPAFQDPFAPKTTTARRAGDAKAGRLRRDEVGRGRDGDEAALAAPLGDASDAAADRSRLSLAAEPVRSSRTEALDGRVALRETPLRGTRPPAAVDDPFAPIGLRLGSFLLYAALDQSGGYSTNLDRAAKGADGAFSDTTLSARFVSDWSRHQAEVDALANYRRNFGGENPSDPDVTVNGRLRLDIDRLTTANLRGGFVYRKEDDTDLDATPDVEGEAKPDILNYSLGGDLERRFGDFLARGTVSAVRETKEGGELPNALDENFNTYTGALRASYEISRAFAPFVEGSLGRRIFDDTAGASGLERDSTIPALRGGVTFDFGEKLNGEAAIGYAWNRPDASAIGTAASPTFDAKLNWSPRRGTDLALTATTTFDPDATGATTSTLYQLGLAARHRATARLDLDASVLAGYRDSDLASETQRTWGASAGFTYWISRSLAFIGLATHDDVDRLHSPGDYTVDTVKLGVRLQN